LVALLDLDIFQAESLLDGYIPIRLILFSNNNYIFSSPISQPHRDISSILPANVDSNFSHINLKYERRRAIEGKKKLGQGQEHHHVEVPRPQAENQEVLAIQERGSRAGGQSNHFLWLSIAQFRTGDSSASLQGACELQERY
jgi:hypothetical protein